ncbi:hypothetical protein D3C78_1316750 [compost metagenome]
MALRSPDSKALAIASAWALDAAGSTGASMPFSWATAAATSASACSQSAACTTDWATGMAQSYSRPLMACSLQPVRTAWRMRNANSGWSLRRSEPTTRADCSCDSEAMDVPSHCTPAAGANSAWRRRWSMLSLPRPRSNAPARCSSSSVLWGLTRAPMAFAPWSCLICCKPLATYSRAVCQSTSFHSPPCLSMGRVRRSSPLSAS